MASFTDIDMVDPSIPHRNDKEEHKLPPKLPPLPEPIIDLLPAPCLHIVLECLDPYEVLGLLCLSKPLNTLINSPSLYWLRFGERR